MLLQAEQIHKMTSISLKMFEVVILSRNGCHFVSCSACNNSSWDKSRVKWNNCRNSTQKMRTLSSKLCYWGHANLVCLSSNLEVLNNLLQIEHSSGFWDFSRQSFWCMECLYFDIKTFPQFWHKTSSNLHFLTCFHIALSVTVDLNGILQVIHFTFVTPPRVWGRMSYEESWKDCLHLQICPIDLDGM